MRLNSTGFAGLAVAAAAVIALQPAPASAGSARTIAGFAVGAVVGAAIIHHATRAAAHPQRSQTASRPAARPSREAAKTAAKSDAKSDGKSEPSGAVNQIDPRTTTAGAPVGPAPGSHGAAASADPFAGPQTARQAPVTQ